MSQGKAQTDELIGQTLNRKYHIIKTIGGGGMGAVYLAQDLQTKQQVAIKVLHPDRQQKETLAKRFMREADISRRLQHPNTISVYDFGQDEAKGSIYLVMEYLDGKTLYRYVREKQYLPLNLACQIAVQMLASLGHAHEKGVIHRDLKPGNVMIMERPSGPPLVKILDFGIAKISDIEALSGEKQRPVTAITQFGEMLGTPHYMPPEQIRGQELKPSADLYAMGVILFFMLTGRRPFEDKEGIQVTIHQLTHPFPRLASFAATASLAADVQELLDRSAKKDSKERFQNAADFERAIAQLRQVSADALRESRNIANNVQPVAPDIESTSQLPMLFLEEQMTTTDVLPNLLEELSLDPDNPSTITDSTAPYRPGDNTDRQEDNKPLPNHLELSADMLVATIPDSSASAAANQKIRDAVMRAKASKLAVQPSVPSTQPSSVLLSASLPSVASNQTAQNNQASQNSAQPSIVPPSSDRVAIASTPTIKETKLEPAPSNPLYQPTTKVSPARILPPQDVNTSSSESWLRLALFFVGLILLGGLSAYVVIQYLQN